MGAAAPVHPTDATLRSYALGKLDDASAGSVSKHLDSCPDCRNRVAEMSSDSFLGRLRDAGIKPGSPVSAPVVSSFAGLSMLDAGVSPGSPPPAGTLPPGLADHPDYDVIRELGQGGMGTVYLAMNRLMGRHEVLKVVSSHLTNRRGVLDRFLVEIRNAARLHHTNIVTAYSASRAGESIIFAMEFVDGLDLAKLVKAKGGLPVANSCNYVHQAALGLQHADDLSMVHRDIKPSNLMLAKQGNRAVIKVLDFGLAKVRSERAVDRGLTHEGQMLGTPDFIAPEQIGDARRADIRADIYSLGCTLYYLLTGGPPFQATSLYEILQAHHSMDALPLNLARPEVPVELAALVARMMAKEPARRFQVPKDVADALVPFFKTGGPLRKASTPEISLAERPEPKQERTSPRSVPAPPVTNTVPAAPPSIRKTAQTTREPLWDSLIEPVESDPAEEPALSIKARKSRKPLWSWAAVIAGLLTLGLVAAWFGGAHKGKAPEGVIVVKNVPEDADIFIDGSRVKLTRPQPGEPLKIRAVPGQRQVEVKKDGFRTQREALTVRIDGAAEFAVALEPFVGAGTEEKAETGQAGNKAENVQKENQGLDPDGVIVVKNVPEDAEIFIDGSRVKFTWPGRDKPLKVRAVPGQRQVEVKKDGFKTQREALTVGIDGAAEFTVALEAFVAAGVEKGAEAGPAVNKAGSVQKANQGLSPTGAGAPLLKGIDLKVLEETLARQKAEFGPDHPNTLFSMINFGNWLAASGRWADAAVQFDTVAKNNGSQASVHRGYALRDLGVARLMLGDQAGYRMICKEFLGQYGANAEGFMADNIATLCVIGEHAVDNAEAVVAVARRADRSNLAYSVVLGGAQFRAGHTRMAIGTIKASFPKLAFALRTAPDSANAIYGGQLQGEVTLAMCYHALHDDSELASHIQKAEALIKKLEESPRSYVSGKVPWFVPVTIELSKRELAKLTLKGQPATK